MNIHQWCVHANDHQSLPLFDTVTQEYQKHLHLISHSALPKPSCEANPRLTCPTIFPFLLSFGSIDSRSRHSSKIHLVGPVCSMHRRSHPCHVQTHKVRTCGSRPCTGHSRQPLRLKSVPRRGPWI